MESTGLKKLIDSLVAESETLQLYKRDPEAFAKKFKLDPDELRALKGADLLFVKRGHGPLAGSSTLTFDTATTVTARTSMTFDTGTTITAGRKGA